MHSTILSSTKPLDQWCSDFSPMNICTSSHNPNSSVVVQGHFLLESKSRSQWSWYFYAPLCLVHWKLLALNVPYCMHLTVLACYWDLSHTTVSSTFDSALQLSRCSSQVWVGSHQTRSYGHQTHFRSLQSTNHMERKLFSLKSKLIAMKTLRPMNTINLHLTYTCISQNHTAMQSWHTFETLCWGSNNPDLNSESSLWVADYSLCYFYLLSNKRHNHPSKETPFLQLSLIPFRKRCCGDWQMVMSSSTAQREGPRLCQTPLLLLCHCRG